MNSCKCSETVLNAGTRRAQTIGPLILTGKSTARSTQQGEVTFKPTYVQKGIGPHLLDWAYASDERWDAFHSNITASKEGVTISHAEGHKKFGINVRWNVEGFGYTFITADNGGEFYELPASGKSQVLNLNHELAKSRVARNRRRYDRFVEAGWQPSAEIRARIALSEELSADARKVRSDDKCGQLSQQALFHALWAAEKMELEKARFDITKRGKRPDFFTGCDVRNYYHMPSGLFMERFTELFDFANLTFVVNGDPYMNILEPTEGALNFELRDVLFRDLRRNGITVGGRTLFWFHKWVTPGWLKSKSFDQLKSYVERHTRAVMSHYGKGMYFWEIVNEMHDWANAAELNPEQLVELTRLACDVAKDTEPDVHRLINHCCPYAEYVQLGQWSSGTAAKYPQRTPWQFTRDLVEAGVDFDLIGQQMYYPYRDLQDIIVLLERFEQFGKKVQVSEIGVSSGPTNRFIKTGKMEFSEEPYPWRRPWDEALQADWLEALYTLSYSKPWIEAACWFDLVDTHAYIDTGGLLRTPEGERKAAFHRLKRLKESWENHDKTGF